MSQTNITHSEYRLKSNKNSLWIKLAIFLAFELFFSAVTMPMLIFYGPFENAKRTLVGMSINTLRHQYIAKFFLSDEAIQRIISSGSAVDPLDSGGILEEIKFTINHSDKIEVNDIDGGDFVGKMMIVTDPTRLLVGYSEQLPRSGETTSAIAKRTESVAAINAGGFYDTQMTGTGGAPMGFIIHDGKVIYDQYNDDTLKWDTVAFNNKGMLIVGKHSIKQLLSLGVKEGVTFGPPLVVNGKPTISRGDGGWGIAPRSAIGQTAKGEVLLLTIDGRSIKSIGATLRDLQDIMLKYKAVNAVNLDGGSSATMFYKGKVINKPSDGLGERAVPSVFMVK